MKVTVRVKTNSRTKGLSKNGDGYIARLSSPPHEGRANLELIELLADYFKVSKSAIEIVSGLKSKKKTVTINSPHEA